MGQMKVFLESEEKKHMAGFLSVRGVQIWPGVTKKMAMHNIARVTPFGAAPTSFLDDWNKRDAHLAIFESRTMECGCAGWEKKSGLS